MRPKNFLIDSKLFVAGIIHFRKHVCVLIAKFMCVNIGSGYALDNTGLNSLN